MDIHLVCYHFNPCQAQEALEAIIDRHGLYVTCEMIEGVCYDKAEHLGHAWQDQVSAKSWEWAAKLFGSLPAKLRKRMGAVA